MAAHRYLIFGKSGWIGGELGRLLEAQGKTFQYANCRNYDRSAVMAEIEAFGATHVLNAAGVTGRPNVDWCEDHRTEVIQSNIVGSLIVADCCEVKGINHMLFATGCIFEYDDEHTIGGKGFTEEDKPNFGASYYSHTKGMVEGLLKEYHNTCILRVRMPISDDLSPRNFVTKILNYNKVVNIPNSMTVLTEFLPISLIMSERGFTGIYNFCNPGAISHNEVLELYKKHVDPTYTYQNFSLEEQALVIKAGRSNNTLDHAKLTAALPDIHIDEIHVAVEKVMIRMRANLEREDPEHWQSKLPRGHPRT